MVIPLLQGLKEKFWKLAMTWWQNVKSYRGKVLRACLEDSVGSVWTWIDFRRGLSFASLASSSSSLHRNSTNSDISTYPKEFLLAKPLFFLQLITSVIAIRHSEAISHCIGIIGIYQTKTPAQSFVDLKSFRSLSFNFFDQHTSNAIFRYAPTYAHTFGFM